MTSSLALTFYDTVAAAWRRSPDQRRSHLIDLHRRLVSHYVRALKRIAPESAALPVPGDGRTVTQVVGHIAEWDRATIIALGEILAGVQWPRIMSSCATVDPLGEALAFADTAAFNAHCAASYRDRDWPAVRDAAIDAATTLFQIFEAPGLLTPARLEATSVYPSYVMGNGQSFELPCGWYLWLATMEHEALEHAAALGIA